jgi:hypothetical protein
VQAKNITVLGGQVLIGEIGPEITEISLAATTGMVTVTTTAPYDTDKYSVGAKILIDTSGTYASDPWANGYFIIASTGASTLTYQSEDLVSGPLSDASAGGFIYLGSQMAVGGDGGSAAAWMTVEGNKFALRNPADPLVTVIEATAGAVTINADFINAGSLNIGDLDANALTATNFSVTNAGVMTAGSGNNVAVISPTDATYRLWLGHSTGASAPFSVTSTGAISATSGSVGGWTLSSTSLTGGDTTISSVGDITLGTGSNVARLSSSDPAYRLWLGGSTASTAPFRVTSTGSFTATDANITGAVSASSGQIGGFTIGATSLTAGSGATAVGIVPASFPFFAGSSTASTAPFRVTSAGSLTATDASITGTITTANITATGGTVGGWTLSSTSFTGGDTTIAATGDITLGTGANVARLSSGDPAYRLWLGGSTASTAPFRVTSTGAVTATDANISGTVTATSGAIGGWVLSSTSLTGGDTTINSTGDITLGTGSNVARLSSSDPAYRLWLGGSTASTAPFRVTSTGALTATGVDISGTISASSGSFTGSVTATSGSIGGWAVDSSRIYNALASNPYIAGVQGSSTSTGVAFFAGGTTSTGATAAFKVTNDGALTATNANITGAVTATSGSFTGTISASAGQIGGWAIGSDRITNLGATKYAGIIDTALDTDLAFFAGATSSSGASALYSVTNAGALTASSGTIGGFILSSTSLTAGTGSSAVGLLPGTFPFFAGNSTASSAPFRVTSEGAVTSSNISITGGPAGGNVINVGSGQFSVDTSGYMNAKTGKFSPGSGTASSGQPALLLAGSSLTGDIAYASGQSLNIGITTATQGVNGAFSEYLRLDANGNMRLNSGYFSVGPSYDIFRVDTSGLTRIGNGSDVAGDLRVYGKSGVDGAVRIYGGASTTAGATLSFDSSASRFNMNNDLNVAGILSSTSISTTGSITLDDLTGLYFTAAGTDGNLYYVAASYFVVNDDLRINMGTTASTSDVYINSSSSYGTLARFSSARRYKKDIQDFNVPLSDIVQLRPVTFKWNPETTKSTETGEITGLIAEEVESISDAMKRICRYNEETGEIESVQYSQLAVFLVGAIKELAQQNTALEARIAALEGA